MDAYFESKKLAKSAKGISRGLTEVQMLCKLTIHIFSGMRDEEAISLPYFCIEAVRKTGRSHYLLHGQTTKLNYGKIRRTGWVTSGEAYEAVIFAQRVAAFTYGSMGCKAGRRDDFMNRYPLFVSAGYLALHGRPPAGTDAFQTQRLRITRRFGHLLETALRPVIEDCDVRELEKLTRIASMAN
ncbi:hypothetical protein [Paraburkholderia terrae]|uniref:hypothetical protein n=1 Tax=Paraburkholderia terrae TaxID=311230 RepID=UPI0033657F42